MNLLLIVFSVEDRQAELSPLKFGANHGLHCQQLQYSNLIKKCLLNVAANHAKCVLSEEKSL
jgi:hypothetical protein